MPDEVSGEAWIRTLLVQANSDDVESVADRLVAQWTSAEDMEHVSHAVLHEAMLEPERCNALANLVCALNLRSPEFPPPLGLRKPVVFSRQLVGLCQVEFESLARSLHTRDRELRKTLVVMCTQEASAGDGLPFRVHCTSLAGRDLGTILARPDEPIGKQVVESVRAKSGCSLAMNITAVSQSGKVLWKEDDTKVLFSLLRFIGILGVRRAVPAKILTFIVNELIEILEGEPEPRQSTEHFVACMWVLLMLAKELLMREPMMPAAKMVLRHLDLRFSRLILQRRSRDVAA
jgi:hypothetical protein